MFRLSPIESANVLLHLKASWIVAALCGLLAEFLMIGRCQAQPTFGIPEPGLLMFGSVTNAAGGLVTNTVIWQIFGAGPDESVTVQATTVSVNGQLFYVVRVPFETRAIDLANFGGTTNVLGLTLNPTTYRRLATVNGTNATIMFSSRGTLNTFSFAAVDRGISERVDLQVNIPVDPSQDSDRDGVPDWAEIVAGTDPHDATSVFKLSADIQVSPEGGLTITWSSISGKTYSIRRTGNLDQPFIPLGGKVAQDTTTSFTDSTAMLPGIFFYQIQVNP